MVTPEFPAPPRKSLETSASTSMKINTSITSSLKLKTPLVKKIKPQFDNCAQIPHFGQEQACPRVSSCGQDMNENNSIEEKVVQV